MTKQLFDYSKYGPRDYTYYGFHLKNGRYHIDTKRLKKLDYSGMFPEGLFTAPRNTHYFIPKHKSEADYAVNLLLEMVNRLTNDWNTEYKDAIGGLKTPKQVKEETRTDMLMYSSSPKDDMDEIDFESLMASIRREGKYDDVIRSIHLQYLQKMFAEYFRAILLVIKDRDYENKNDFKYKDFFFYVQRKSNVESKRANPLYKLPHYKHFNLLHKIDIFLKHNSRNAYEELANNAFEKDEDLKAFLSNYVYSDSEAKHPYENGMYAGYWLKINSSFVDEMLNNLREFSIELCKLLYDEDASEASWNSDEYLVRILRTEIIDFPY